MERYDYGSASVIADGRRVEIPSGSVPAPPPPTWMRSRVDTVHIHVDGRTVRVAEGRPAWLFPQAPPLPEDAVPLATILMRPAFVAAVFDALQAVRRAVRVWI